MKLIITFLLITISAGSVAQNYTSTSNGPWTATSNWNNTSGWGTSTPPIDGSQGSGTITMNNNMTINSAYNTGSSTLNINAGKTLTVNANMTLGGGSTVNVSGNLVINGDLALNSTLNILPGGVVTVYGNVIVNSSNYLIVGTGTAGPPYAELIIKNDLKQKSSGDVTLNKNARVAVLGNVSDNADGGTKLTLNQGAEMYVNGNINYSGGGDHIDNNNATSPYGLYVNGSTNNSGGGSSTTANEGDKATMIATNPVFATWVSTQLSLMPVALMSFDVSNENGIELKWTVATEENLDYYLLEYSSDGREFFELGRTTDHNYLVGDPAVGRTYYRLTSVDLDGSKQVFKIVSAVYESSKQVKVFPNPVVDSKLNVDFNFNPAEEVTVTFTNLNGMEVSRQVLNGMQNLLALSMDAGTYILKVQSTEISSVSRIVIK